jgi:hypothetical protein
MVCLDIFVAAGAENKFRRSAALSFFPPGGSGWQLPVVQCRSVTRKGDPPRD